MGRPPSLSRPYDPAAAARNRRRARARLTRDATFLLAGAVLGVALFVLGGVAGTAFARLDAAVAAASEAASPGVVTATAFVLTDSTGREVIGSWGQERLGTYLRVVAPGAPPTGSPTASPVGPADRSAVTLWALGGAGAGRSAASEAGVFVRHPSGPSVHLGAAEGVGNVVADSPPFRRAELSSGPPGSEGAELVLTDDRGATAARYPPGQAAPESGTTAPPPPDSTTAPTP